MTRAKCRLRSPTAVAVGSLVVGLSPGLGSFSAGAAGTAGTLDPASARAESS
jgi:hypothetical protein